MSRSGYSDDWDWDQESRWANIRWRGQVASAIRGKRGQEMFKEMLQAFDDMPVKELIKNELDCDDGVCALGALGRKRGIDMSGLDPDDSSSVAAAFNIADQLAREVVYMNDENAWYKETPQERFVRMRRWVVSNINDALEENQ